MIKTTLACADACGAIFDRAFMNQCDFGNMDCRGASFIKASLIQCKAKDLNGAKGTFTQAVLRGSCLDRASLRGAVLQGVDFQTLPAGRRTLQNRSWIAPLCLKEPG